MAMLNLATLPLFLDIAQHAVDLARAEREVGAAKAELNAHYSEWKFVQGIEFVARDSAEWEAMMLATAEPFADLERAKRNARNTKNRMLAAVTKYEAREAGV